MAGVIGNPIAYKGTINMAQADSLTDTGIYFINGTSSSNALTNDGTLVMFKGHNYTQTFYSSSNPIAAYIRRRVGTTGDWTPWQRIDNFGYNSLKELAGGVAGNMLQGETSAKSLDEYKNTGFYKGYDFLDKPVSAGVSILEVFAYTSEYVFQRFNVIDGECSTYIRKYQNKVWSDWVKL